MIIFENSHIKLERTANKSGLALTSEELGEVRKWVEALRSGKYPRSMHVLQDRKGFCCLGVACEVLIENPERNKIGTLRGVYPEDQSNSPEWLKVINRDIERVTRNSLSYLNDRGLITFNDAADIIETIYLNEGSQNA